MHWSSVGHNISGTPILLAKWPSFRSVHLQVKRSQIGFIIKITLQWTLIVTQSPSYNMLFILRWINRNSWMIDNPTCKAVGSISKSNIFNIMAVCELREDYRSVFHSQSYLNHWSYLRWCLVIHVGPLPQTPITQQQDQLCYLTSSGRSLYLVGRTPVCTFCMLRNASVHFLHAFTSSNVRST